MNETIYVVINTIISGDETHSVRDFNRFVSTDLEKAICVAKQVIIENNEDIEDYIELDDEAQYDEHRVTIEKWVDGELCATCEITEDSNSSSIIWDYS